jgi:hypothetical protein
MCQNYRAHLQAKFSQKQNISILTCVDNIIHLVIEDKDNFLLNFTQLSQEITSQAEREVNSLVSRNCLLFLAGRPPWRAESHRLQFPEPSAKRDQTQKQRLQMDKILRAASLSPSTVRGLNGNVAKGHLYFTKT